VLLSPPDCRWHCRLREDTAESAQASTATCTLTAAVRVAFMQDVRILRRDRTITHRGK
jgi:hypothetical protein